MFRYERSFRDTLGLVREVLSNDSLYREIDGRKAELSEWQKQRLHSSLNSVVYFALLPYRLNDAAVRKRYLGETVVSGEPYHKVEVTFRREGGGRDYQDRFVYWFHRERKTMDYLAYTFQSGDGGTRFRQAVHPRVIGGLRFADYLNFTADSVGVGIEAYDALFENRKLRKISEIVLENVTVRLTQP